MGCRKGIKHRIYTPEEKLDIVLMHTQQYLSYNKITKITGISFQNVQRWVKQYSAEGIEGLEARKKGNPYAALHSSKSLSEQERLQLENLKLKIENERLKKGYLVKGGGTEKEYVPISGKNTRS